MPRKIFLLSLIIMACAALWLQAENIKDGSIQLTQIQGSPQRLYPFSHTPQLALEDPACTVRMAGDAYWAVSDWMVGDEVYTTYQDPSVEGLNCPYPFEIEAITMQLQFAAAGSLWCEVDITELDTAQSVPSCPVPGYTIAISDQWGFYVPCAGLYNVTIEFDVPVEVDGPYFAGFYIANDVLNLGVEVITDNDPYLCVNWNDWGDGYVDLVSNQYFNFPGNLILFSLGNSIGGNPGDTQTRAAIAWPRDSSSVSGNIYLRTTELSDNIASAYCRFEYYHSSLGWTVIGDDYDANVTLRNTISPVSFSEGYSVVWNASGMAEGWYPIRSTVFDSSGYSTLDSINVYVDNTPLEPVFNSPLWGETICDSTTLGISLSDEDVSFLQFMYRSAQDTLTINPPFLLQRRYGDVNGDTTDGNLYSNGEYGDFYNAPTALACLIRYFANSGYSDLALEESTVLTDSQIVEVLADSMKVRDNLGTEDDNFLWYTQKYFKNKGNQFDFELLTSLTPQQIDFIMGYRQGAILSALGQPYGLWLVITEISFPANPDNSYNIRVYDTKTGFNFESNIIFDPLPQIEYIGAYRTVDLSLGIYPKTNSASENIIGLDFNPADGFSYFWNFSALEEGHYYISATGTDNGGHLGNGFTRATLSCAMDYIPSDVNADGSINISDAVYIINYIFTGGDEPKPFRMNGDSNCDGSVNVSDAVYIINYIFTGGSPPCNTK